MNWAGRYVTGYAQPPSHTEDMMRRQAHEAHVAGFMDRERLRKTQDERQRWEQRQRRDAGGYATGQEVEEYRRHRRAEWWPHVRETWDVPAFYAGQDDPNGDGTQAPSPQPPNLPAPPSPPAAPPPPHAPAPPPPQGADARKRAALHKRVHLANHGDKIAVKWFQKHGRHPCGQVGAPCVKDRIGLWVHPTAVATVDYQAPPAPDYEALAPQPPAPQYQQQQYVPPPQYEYGHPQAEWNWHTQWYGQPAQPGWHPATYQPVAYGPGVYEPGYETHPGFYGPHPGVPEQPVYGPQHPVYQPPGQVYAPPGHPVYEPPQPGHPVYGPQHPGGYAPPTPGHPVYSPQHPGVFTPPHGGPPTAPGHPVYSPQHPGVFTPPHGGPPTAPGHPVYSPQHPGVNTPPHGAPPTTPSHPVYSPQHPGVYTPPHGAPPTTPSHPVYTPQHPGVATPPTGGGGGGKTPPKVAQFPGPHPNIPVTGTPYNPRTYTQ